MAQRVWTIELEDGRHTVQLDHGYISGKRRISVDGRQIEETARAQDALFDIGSSHTFSIGAHRCTVVIRSKWGLAYEYDLLVDGRSVATGAVASAQAPVPAWGYLFIAACGLIPVVSLGGAVPAAIGAAGAFGCLGAARDGSKSVFERASRCLAITAGCWVIFLLFLIAVGTMLGR
jgi:hypothetical protein